MAVPTKEAENEMEKQETREEVSRLIAGAMRPYDRSVSVTAGGAQGGATGGVAPQRGAGRLRALANPEVILNIVCVLLALGFLALAASNLTMSGNFLSIDSLFLTAVALMLAGIFLINPALWAKEHGYLRRPAAEATVVVEEGPIHFEGTTKLFGMILGALLALTLVEVLLAYFHVPLVIMLTILMGLSVIKAALIMAYFMHLRFERLSLVLSLVPVMVVCICLLFFFFPDSYRSKNLRATPNIPAAATTSGEAGETSESR